MEKIDLHYSEKEIEEKIKSFKENPKSYNEEMLKIIQVNGSKYYLLSKNLRKIYDKIKEITLENNHDEYKAYSTIFGAFLGDSLGSYCEFTHYFPSNYKNIFKGPNVFGCPPGQITDDSEMALSMAYAIMDNPDSNNLNSDLLYYYYGNWMKSSPIDIGRTTINALKHFSYENFNVESKGVFESSVRSLVAKVNHDSLSNGFLMRISPFVAWYYYKNKNSIIEDLKSKDGEKFFKLFTKITKSVTIDNETTHSNEEVFIASGVFVFMALNAMCDYSPKEILENIQLLVSHKGFMEGAFCTVENIITGYLKLFESRFFDQEKFFKGVSDKNIGHYVHAIRLTLYFLYFFDEIEECSNYSKYREIMNQICNCGGDTDTNAAIVGCVIGPIIGFDNFGKELSTLLLYSPKKRPFYTSAMIYFFVNFLEESNKETTTPAECRYNTFKAFMTLLNVEMK